MYNATYVKPMATSSPTNAISPTTASDFMNLSVAFLTNFGAHMWITPFINASHPIIGMMTNHSPVNFQ